MQELIVTRLGDGWGIARLESEGREWFSMENPELQIRAETYKVILTPSDRAKAGTLWTCWPKFMLPLLTDSEGNPMLLNHDKRSGIRMHAANLRKQLQGCLAFGKDRTRDSLVASQAALKEMAAALVFPFLVTINDPKEK